MLEPDDPHFINEDHKKWYFESVDRAKCMRRIGAVVGSDGVPSGLTGANLYIFSVGQLISHSANNPIKFEGITAAQAVDILTNGCCGD